MHACARAGEEKSRTPALFTGDSGRSDMKSERGTTVPLFIRSKNLILMLL